MASMPETPEPQAFPSSQPLSTTIRQSPPLDLSIPYSADWVKSKTILITGGASGFGAAFVKHWANHGATTIFCDINVSAGHKLEIEIRKETGNDNVHFRHCDVTNWQSQVNFFKEAVKLSPHGGIDCVVPNAGIAREDPLQMPGKLDVPEPPEPDFKILDVDLIGVMYTIHLAFFYLPRNPDSKECSTSSDPTRDGPRDRHILLMGSVASLFQLPFQPQYGAAKHAVLGLFRSLRSSSFVHGVRVNMICPYFIDTTMVTTGARFVLAGGALGKVEDVVDAATRFVADSRISGRAVVVGPKLNFKQETDGSWKYVPEEPKEGTANSAIWEAYADDWVEVDAFCHRVVKLINRIHIVRGWYGWGMDLIKAIIFGFRTGRL